MDSHPTATGAGRALHCAVKQPVLLPSGTMTHKHELRRRGALVQHLLHTYKRDAEKSFFFASVPGRWQRPSSLCREMLVFFSYPHVPTYSETCLFFHCNTILWVCKLAFKCTGLRY